MENNQEPNEELVNKINKQTEEKIEEVQEEKQLKQKWKEEIMANESAMNFLKSKGDHVVDSFIKFYVARKYSWYSSKEFYLSQAPKVETKWIKECEKHLELIQKKKLFDLQCLWNANKIKVEGVSIMKELHFYYFDVFNCPYIEPITTSDIQIYQDFLKQDTVILDQLHLDDHYSYDEILENFKNNNLKEISVWFTYHFEKTNTFYLLDLPKHRTEKEEYYKEIAKREEEKTNPTSNIPIATYVPSKYLSIYDRKQLRKFVEKFEDEDIKRKFHYYQEQNPENSMHNTRLGSQFYELVEQSENIPIKAHKNHRKAIAIAYNDYTISKIIQALPLAHEEYLKKLKTNTFESKGFEIPWIRVKKDKQLILKGRHLADEPLDFEY